MLTGVIVNATKENATVWRSKLERSPRKWRFGCSSPSRDRPKSLKQVGPVPLPNARQ